jgi:hypothetical protein
MEGFTVLLSEEVLKNDEKSTLERKPLQALELELKTINKILPPEAVRVLRNVLIWVEWDQDRAASTGRSGKVIAIFSGGHQQAFVQKGEHPLKAKSVTVLRLKQLAAEHQPKNDSGGCTLLHELAHAVHYELLGGKDYPPIVAAYKQAMERKLYDKSTYASTNESEFFAELTCAYFDQLEYYPRNRAELKKHDAVTYSLMEKTWGKQKVALDPATTTRNTGDPTLKLDKLELGKPVMGPKVALADLKGRVAAILYWNSISESSMSSFQKLSAWDTELNSFGLTTVAVHLSGKQQKDFAAEAKARNVSFAITESLWTDKTLVVDFKDFPLFVVFDAEGQCIFRGSPFDAEEAVRSAVGKVIVASCGRESFSKPVTPVVEALQKGKPPLSQLAPLIPLTRSNQADTAEEAKQLLGKIIEPGRAALEAGETMMKDDPVGAYLKLEKLPATYKGTTLAVKATELLTKLKADKAVQLEIRAHTNLAYIQRMDRELGSRPGSFDPKLEQYRKDNATALKVLQESVLQMKKSWPTTRATQEAVRIGEKYGLTVN